MTLSANSSNPSFPPVTQRLNREASSSSISSCHTQHSVVHRLHAYDRPRTGHFLRHGGNICQNEHAHLRNALKPLAVSCHCSNCNSTAEHGETRSRFEVPRQDRSLRSNWEPPAARQPARGVDLLSIPSGKYSRRTTIFIGPGARSAEEQPTRTPALAGDGPQQTTSRTAAKMHRPVNKDDYLLARGANPRTGVVTPGCHSVNSSVDHDAGVQPQDMSPHNRWRQRGDQWVSLDLNEPTVLSTPPKGTLPGSYRPYLRTPPKLTVRKHGAPMSDDRIASAGIYGQQKAPFHKTSPDMSATFQLRKRSDGIDFYPDMLRDDQLSPAHKKPKRDQRVRRRPVGTPPRKPSVDQGLESRGNTNGKNETVLQTPRFEIEARSFSAPHPSRPRNITPRDIDKVLPTLPKDRVPSEYEKIATQNPFLGPQMSASMADATVSKTSDTSGRRIIEKDLPCLPTNNGQSPLIRQTARIQTTDREEIRTEARYLPMPTTEPLKGPRGGNQAYPFVRTARQVHPHPQTKRHNGPGGDRAMPVPVYDNPPKHLSPPPLMRPMGPLTEGPRSRPPPGSSALNMWRDDFNPLSNTTTTHNNIYTGRPGAPRQLRAGLRPPVTDPRIMSHGRLGWGPRPPPPHASGIFMNTGMNMSTDMMMSAPLPRIRPRGATRPPMPARADGSYGVPRLDPSHDRSNTTSVEFPEMWIPRGQDDMATRSYVENEPDLIPPPLKPRVPTTQERPVLNEVQPSQGAETAGGHALTRKCSRCHHGFVPARPRNTDSIIPTSDHRKDDGGADVGSRPVHPTGSPLPRVPEGLDYPGMDMSKAPSTISTASVSDVDQADERDHTICCPDCCKDEDCHEGCLGHPSPSLTPSPTKSMWSEAPSLSSASEMGESEDTNSVTSSKNKGPRFGFLLSAFRKMPYQDNGKPNHKGKAKAQYGPNDSPNEVFEHLRTPDGATAAAVSAIESAKYREAASGYYRRHRSPSSPVIGGGPSGAPSGSRLRMATPTGLAIACSGLPRGRNVSGGSVTTLELQVPGLGTLGIGAIGEMMLVPFEATKMWIRHHPHVMRLGWDIMERGWHMGQTMTATGWKLWAVIFVYSKTGKLRLSVSRGETAGGFVIDCARSALYLLMFAALSVFVIRVLRVVLGVASIIGWFFQGVFWVVKHVLGFGFVRWD